MAWKAPETLKCPPKNGIKDSHGNEGGWRVCLAFKQLHERTVEARMQPDRSKPPATPQMKHISQSDPPNPVSAHPGGAPKNKLQGSVPAFICPQENTLPPASATCQPPQARSSVCFGSTEFQVPLSPRAAVPGGASASERMVQSPQLGPCSVSSFHKLEEEVSVSESFQQEPMWGRCCDPVGV